ncbi:MAG: signal peptidase I [Thermodesulfobacteriota bacterium]
MAEKKSKGVIRENLEIIIIAVILAMFIRTFVVQAFKIPSGSMEDTLLVGDHLLVNKFIYGVKIPFTDGKTLIPVSEPERGDIVVFRYPQNPEKDYIKRVVGIEGDVVEIVDKKLYVNGEQVNHDYAHYTDDTVYPAWRNPRDNMEPMTVPEDSLFVMGDNRDNSHDSRFWGFVDLKAVKGEAFIIYWSWDRDSFDVRWNRIGDLLI